MPILTRLTKACDCVRQRGHALCHSPVRRKRQGAGRHQPAELKRSIKRTATKSPNTRCPTTKRKRLSAYATHWSRASPKRRKRCWTSTLAGESFTDEELRQGLRQGVLKGDVVPVVCGSALTGFGTMQLLEPSSTSPLRPTKCAWKRVSTEDGEPVEVKYDPDGKTIALVFKTIADQYGRFSFFKVISGKVTSDMMLQNTRSGASEKNGAHLYCQGQKETTK